MALLLHLCQHLCMDVSIHSSAMWAMLSDILQAWPSWLTLICPCSVLQWVPSHLYHLYHEVLMRWPCHCKWLDRVRRQWPAAGCCDCCCTADTLKYAAVHTWSSPLARSRAGPPLSCHALPHACPGCVSGPKAQNFFRRVFQLRLCVLDPWHWLRLGWTENCRISVPTREPIFQPRHCPVSMDPDL